MPVVPVLPGFAGLDGWSLWKQGRITAANVTWSADAIDPEAQQNLLLSQLAFNKCYNAIRLVLSAGSSDSAWDDMYLIATDPAGWDSTATLASGGQKISEIRDNIQNILDKCKNLGMGVILDCHDFFQRNQSSGAVGPLWTGTWARPAPNSGTTLTASQLRDALVSFWTKTVQAFPVATYTAIIGYEILNEPNPDPSLTFAQMESGVDNCWSKLATRCIKAIRALDLNTPIIVDGIYYADPYGLKYFDPTLNGAGLLNDYLANGTPKNVSDRRLVYSFHSYGPYEFTHQGVSADTYELQGLQYPLNFVPPVGDAASAAYKVSPRLRVTVYDGSSTAVTANGGSTTKTLYLPFNNYSHLLARNQPAVDFQSHAAAAQSGTAPPIFVGEFSAVDTTLIQPTWVPTTTAKRTITRIQVDATTGWATVTVAGNFNIPLLPFYDDANHPDTTNAYSDFARATITGCANSAYDLATPKQVRLEHGNNQIVLRTWNAANFGFQYDSASGVFGTDYSPPGGALLTISQGVNSRSYANESRANFVKDVLTMCISKGFSWAYWQEDGYTATASTIASLSTGIFVGWRPSALVSQALNRAASRRAIY